VRFAFDSDDQAWAAKVATLIATLASVVQAIDEIAADITLCSGAGVTFARKQEELFAAQRVARVAQVLDLRRPGVELIFRDRARRGRLRCELGLDQRQQAASFRLHLRSRNLRQLLQLGDAIERFDIGGGPLHVIDVGEGVQRQVFTHRRLPIGAMRPRDRERLMITSLGGMYEGMFS
jgi:hypothetical protein